MSSVGVGHLTATDAANRTTTYWYDAQNRLYQTKAPDGGVIKYGYDTEGRLKSVTDPRTFVTTYTYNGFGQILTRTSPDTGKTTYHYDTAGRLDVETPNDGVAIGYGYDAIGRLRSRTANGVVETYTYDGGSFDKGRLSSIANDLSGSTSFSYDDAGQLIKQVADIVKSTSPPAGPTTPPAA